MYFNKVSVIKKFHKRAINEKFNLFRWLYVSIFTMYIYFIELSN